MQYNQPYGGAADAPYIDGIPPTGVEGSIIPAAAVEVTQREIVNFILKSQLSPTNGDLTQLARSVQVDLVNFAIDTGTLNHIVIVLDPAPATLVAGLKAFIIIKFTNTGSTDVSCNGIVKPLLTQGLVNLPAGVIVANGIAMIVYDGTQWQLMLGTAATGGPAGPTGATGAAGSAGVAGAVGAQGIQGIQGPAGPTGPAGSPTSLIVAPGAVGVWGIWSAVSPQVGYGQVLPGQVWLGPEFVGTWRIHIITTVTISINAQGAGEFAGSCAVGLAQRIA